MDSNRNSCRSTWFQHTVKIVGSNKESQRTGNHLKHMELAVNFYDDNTQQDKGPVIVTTDDANDVTVIPSPIPQPTITAPDATQTTTIMPERAPATGHIAPTTTILAPPPPAPGTIPRVLPAPAAPPAQHDAPPAPSPDVPAPAATVPVRQDPAPEVRRSSRPRTTSTIGLHSMDTELR